MEADMAFTLPDLPYSHDALAELGMSAETLEYHHDLHHNAYVVNGNKLVSGTEWDGKSLEDIITGTYDKSGSCAERHFQQRLAALEPHAVLGNDGSRQNRDAVRAGISAH
jgi:superoxide dismutase